MVRRGFHSKRDGYLRGAAILSAAVAVTKLLGFAYKIPLQNMLGDEGSGIFNATYNVYGLLLSVSTAGVPLALSRLVAAAAQRERPNQVRRLRRAAAALFTAVGLVCAAAMVAFSRPLAALVGVPETRQGILVLAPAVLLCCVSCAFRGYGQGLGDMRPTSAATVLEVSCKLVLGLAASSFFLRRGAGLETVCAGAIVGVTVGLGLGLPVLWAMIRRREASDPLFFNTCDEPDGYGRVLADILKTSVPITLGASALHFFALIDTRLIVQQLRQGMGVDYGTAKALFGVYAKSQTLFTLPSSLVAAPITVSVVPAIAGALARRDGRGAKELMESALRVTNLLAMPAAMGMSMASTAIYGTLYGVGSENGPVLLAILGASSYFVCLHQTTAAILQACGREKTSLWTVPAGGAVKVAACYFLVGRVGIVGAPVGMLVCYAVICALNLTVILLRVRQRPNLLRVTLRPLLCAVTMGACTWSVQGLLLRRFPALASSRAGMAAILAVTVALSVFVYASCAVCFGAVTERDAPFLPQTARRKLFALKSPEKSAK